MDLCPINHFESLQHDYKSNLRKVNIASFSVNSTQSLLHPGDSQVLKRERGKSPSSKQRGLGFPPKGDKREIANSENKNIDVR